MTELSATPGFAADAGFVDLTDDATDFTEAPAATDAGREPAPAGSSEVRIPGDRSRLALAAFMAGVGILHFVVPGFFERIVPRWIGHEKAAVRWSGAAEVLCGALLAVPGTARLGAWSSLVTMIVVYPANVQMALDVGKPTTAFGVGVWIRLPLQVPLWAWAYRRATR